MTKEQIAELRHLAGYEECLLDLCFAMVPLIDEREALLTALKELLARVPLSGEELGARVRLARAAIEKAEAPYVPPPKTVFVSSRPSQK